MMKKWIVAFVVMLPALAMAESRVGVIDPIGALQAADNVKARMSALEKELGADEQRLNSLRQEVGKMQEKIQKEGMTMSSEQQEQMQTEGQQKMIEIQSLQRKLQKRANDAQRELLQEMEPKLQSAVAEVAKKENLDLVVSAQAVIYTKPDLDITEAVTKQLNKMK
ncbi:MULTISPECIES: OmpH family outer membrane protein [unclassified Alcanivorax]|jgi:outer membrane protein|uniref:OmpH family outer membrane protein n=1 Tax=unclassified Alcanivorax TaxID=2638842 RepID=UPI000789D568|nr:MULTISPECIES: OmpH family outer membrane protein [unclassified Alcanivorax]KZX76085.1 hypothetical protein A3716_20280 [Alcanivorax sp. HI0011]KZX82481.1 hypothetical protein A3717_07760 [Alcanivorax sp. HI0013]KZY20201.1 hypothetical protein A3725_33635 [Alcanivorax sp. HI0035]MEE2603003.1 OmpH family outer membrane protein [Pseudomonadota bacterium]KZX62401.1 hypothetical protein A3713_06255 [Alcanivorax sp. HI0003]|tara:strand:- start:166 stop:663 length:498 start_codon:yes stop_codon:yes gene_type:complete